MNGEFNCLIANNGLKNVEISIELWQLSLK